MSPGNVKVKGSDYHAVDVHFINSTGSVVYITAPRVRVRSSALLVPKVADRDIAQAVPFTSPPLKTTPIQQAVYRIRLRHENLLCKQTGAAHGAIVVMKPMPDDFYTYTVPRWRRLLRRPKYFRLEYSAMVGRKLHSIATIY